MDQPGQRSHSQEQSPAQINPFKFEQLDIHLLQKYVDDVITCLNKVKPGVRFDPGTKTLSWDSTKVAEDNLKDQEQMTMEIFCQMASSLVGCLEYTWDSPSRHPTGKMPVLDTEMWIGKPTRAWDLLDAILPPGISGITTNRQVRCNILYQEGYLK